MRGQRGFALPHAGVFPADFDMDPARRLTPDFHFFQGEGNCDRERTVLRLTPRQFVRPEPRGPDLFLEDRSNSASNLEKARSLRMR